MGNNAYDIYAISGCRTAAVLNKFVSIKNYNEVIK